MGQIVHKFKIMSRSGTSRWTVDALSSWIEVLTGHQVNIRDLTRSGWFTTRKVLTFELQFSGTPEEAQSFLSVIQQHFKVEPLA
ncbi:hypothetical protein [Deinococcus cellulosilyticus]|uniref:Uncharacterized protein n=1 Tax=Deinococcus cellulosilyticus (strain DSM 18568 / NBRC 106333 / KACC 11606 / 5516J-15) TaxID=1223518 RepID=A0A511N1P8_DEIC1|nr:hypothetical protein [Deinococcus cellulosilyticus]GEM46361.1 hypothetical protein DC3_19960 [Deinococcus cellulosilyticus NBRC 106333 = KACC 11606]